MNPAWTTVVFERAEGSRRRVVTWVARRANPIERTLAWLLLVAAACLLLGLAFVVLVVTIPLAIAGAAALALTSAARRARGPTGFFDGRRNVRVIVPDER